MTRSLRYITAALFLTLGVSLAASNSYHELPLAFEPNLGQTDQAVRFLARAPGQLVYVTSTGATLALDGHSAVLALRFPNSQAVVDIAGLDRLPGHSHYLRGGAPEAWQRSVPTYSRVRGRALYSGIDVVYYGNRGRLEYDFVVAASADPEQIRMRFDGTDSVELTDVGDLLIQTEAGSVRQHRPVAYQVKDGDRVSVEASYLLAESGEISIKTGPYDSGYELIIDPVISYSSFLGGTGLEEGLAIAVDEQGFIYIAGGTESPDFPVTAGVLGPAYNSTQFPGDAFVTKLSPDGKSVVFSTFLGGRDRDTARAIAVDALGGIYVAGDTESLDFPTVLAYQGFNASIGVYPDGFVSKLSPDGSFLVYSTYLGDDFTDQVHAIAVDAQGQAYIAGASDSDRFPVSSDASQISCPGFGLGGFVSKISVHGSALVYSTRLCGSANDEILALSLDSQGSAYVGGVTSSTDFPVTLGAYRMTGGGDNEDGFVVKLATDGRSLAYSTYLGGSDSEAVQGIALDGQGNAVVTGFTHSTDYPATDGALQSTHADGGAFEDAFVTKLNDSGSGLLSSTYLGGSGSDQGMAVDVDSQGAMHVTGFTASSDFPVTGALCQTAYGGKRDAFAARLNPSGSALDYSLLLSGREDEMGLAIAAGPNGDSFVTGRTSSSNFTTTPDAYRPAYQDGYRGASDAFLARVSSGAPPAPPCVALNGLMNAAAFLPGPVSPGELVAIFGFGLGPVDAVQFQLVNGFIPTEVAGTRVLFDGVPGPVILSYTGQVNAIVPYSVAGKDSVVVSLEYQGVTTTSFTVAVAESSPGIFTRNASGRGLGAILNQNLSENSPQNPAAKGSIIVIYATGEGQTNPPGIDGKVAVIGELPKPALPVSVRVGGLDAVVHYAGAAAGLVAGVIQINAQLAPNVAAGNAVPVTIQIGEHASPIGVTVAIQ